MNNWKLTKINPLIFNGRDISDTKVAQDLKKILDK